MSTSRTGTFGPDTDSDNKNQLISTPEESHHCSSYRLSASREATAEPVPAGHYRKHQRWLPCLVLPKTPEPNLSEQAAHCLSSSQLGHHAQAHLSHTCSRTELWLLQRFAAPGTFAWLCCYLSTAVSRMLISESMCHERPLQPHWLITSSAPGRQLPGVSKTPH